MVKLQQFVISELDDVHHWSRVATQQPTAQASLLSDTFHEVSVTSHLAKNIQLTVKFCWNIIS